MGSDGTLGLRAIKEKGGAGFVQSLASAKFDGMPRSAIDAGLADVVAPARRTSGSDLAYKQHAPFMTRRASALRRTCQGRTRQDLHAAPLTTGNDFSSYKQSTIYRRIERRMGLHQIDKIANYVRFLRENPRELDLLFRELLIGVTNFFRDPAVVGPPKERRLAGAPGLAAFGRSLRAWVPGCSTGEEAYSLAMVFREAIEPLRPVKNLVLQIFATDLDRDAIERARQALYPENIAADVSPERLRRFFVRRSAATA